MPSGIFAGCSQYYRITTDQTAQSIEDEDIVNILKCAMTCVVPGTAGAAQAYSWCAVQGRAHASARVLRHHGVDVQDRLLRVMRSSPLPSLCYPTKRPWAAPARLPEVAVLEHNVMACSKLYDNMSFYQQVHLDITPFEAEKICSKMI